MKVRQSPRCFSGFVPSRFSARPAARKPAPGRLPFLERLEGRTVPSVAILNNGGSGYAGLDFKASGGYIPPDTCGAAGPSNYVETVNQEIGIYSPKSTGATRVLDSFSHFWFTTGALAQADSGSKLSDPSMVYDDLAGRFIIGDLDVDTTTHVSNFDVAVSRTSNPATLTTADWEFYSISTTEQGSTNYDADYPGNIGYNHDAVVITLNMLAVIGNHTQIISINSSDLVNGVTPRVYKKDLLNGVSYRPTTMHDSVAGDPMWLVAENGDNAKIVVYELTNVLATGQPLGYNTTLSVTPYQSVAPVLNPDGSVITSQIDSRILKAAAANHTIVACHTVGVSSTQDAAQWYRINVASGTPVLADQGRVTAGNNTYTSYAAIDINAFGDIGMSYMQSGTDSSSDYLSMWVTARSPADTAGTMPTPVKVPAGAGQANYADLGQRAGDFSGINVDQSDGSFWAANEFANADAGANWGTAIANFTSARTDTWTGAGSNANWSTPANWSGNVAPVPGCSLVFPAGALQLTNTNDFAGGTGFSSVTISGNGYAISGQGLMTGSIDASGSTGTNQFLADLNLTGDQTITLPAAAGIQLDLGNLTNDGNTFTFTGGPGTVLVEGGVTGAGGLTVNGTGDVILQNNNTFGYSYGGPTLVSSGTLSLAGKGEVPASSALTVNGTFDLGGLTDTVATLSGSGNVTLGSGTLTVGVNPYFPASTTFSGAISGTGGLTVTSLTGGTNNGYFYLTGKNTYTGTTTVSSNLGGTGSIAGPVTVDGTSGTAALVPSAPTFPYIGTLMTGPVTFVNSGQYSASIRGPNPGADYNQLDVNGSVTITNGYLSTQLTNSPQPLLGQVYTIISATGPITGTFVGYPEGTKIDFGFATLAISYQAGGGHQVTLTVVAVTPNRFQVSGFPSPAPPGSTNGFTVTGVDSIGNVVAGYRGTVYFTSSDPQAVLPADYTFTAADAGVHTFSAALYSPGNESITATDTVKTSVTGSESNIFVQHGTTTTVGSSSNPATYGNSVTFTATVTNTSDTNTPSGGVEFYDGSTDLGAGAGQGGSSGIATWTLSTADFAAGTHPIKAVFHDPFGNFEDSSNAAALFDQTIDQRNITLTAAPNTKVYDGTTTAAAIPTITAGSLAAGDVATFSETYDTSKIGPLHTLTPAVVSIKDSGGNNVTADYNVTLAAAKTGVIRDYSLTLTMASPLPLGVGTTGGKLATFTDADPSPKLTDFTAVISWGDGYMANASSADNTIRSNPDGSFSIYGTHVYPSSTLGQSMTVSIQLLDNGAATPPATANQVLTGGPTNGPYQQATQSYTKLIKVAHQSNVAGVYNPAASGALNSLSYSFDFEVISGPSTSAQVGVGFLLKQGSNYYVAGYHGVGQNGWNIGATTSVTASSFTLVSGTVATPNFSAAGAPLEFGYYTINSSNGTAIRTMTFGTANFTVTINGTKYADANMKNSDWTYQLLQSDDLGSAAAAGSGSFTVGDAPLAVTLQPPNPTAGTPITSQTVATFTDGDQNAKAGDFQATIKWGDGFVSNASSADSSLVQNADGSFSIKGSHTYLKKAAGLSFSVQVIDVAYKGAQTTTTQETSGGPSNSAYQQGTQTYTSGIVVGHLSKGAGYYDPSVSGALTSLSYSFDFKTISGPSTTAAIGVAFLLRQGNNYYTANYKGIGQNGWNTGTPTSLTASSFALQFGTQKLPDFSTAGAPMEFGYYTANSTTAGKPITMTFGVANFGINVNGNAYIDTVFSNSNWVEALLKFDTLGDAVASPSAQINVN
jgi:hypothetical protein